MELTENLTASCLFDGRQTEQEVRGILLTFIGGTGNNIFSISGYNLMR